MNIKPITYLYKGVTITFEQNRGVFTSTINGQRCCTMSLDGMKKAITQNMLYDVKPFKAIYINWDDKINFALIKGIVKANKVRREDQFYDDQGYRMKMPLLRDTAINRATLKHFLAFKKEQQVKIQALQKSIDTEYELLGMFTPDTYTE